MADVTDATFKTAVIDRSYDVPVVVDLWAEWCGPCKQLGPVLEQVIAETDGKVELAKVDVDANPQISQMFRVQSIPAVFVVRDGKVADSFVGAQPEQVVRAFVAAHAPAASPADLLVARGDEASLREALALEPGHVEATLSLAAILLARNEPDAALEVLAKIPESGEAAQLAARARMAKAGVDPSLDVEATLAGLLDRVKADDDARQEFIDLLEVLGPEDPRTATWRKKLTARLF